MRAYERVLEDGGVVILAEPGAAHEHAPVAIDAMQKYGILEKGMELADVRAYVRRHDARGRAALPAADWRRTRSARTRTPGSSTKHSVVEGNLFRLTKGGRRPSAAPAARSPGLSLARISTASGPRVVRERDPGGGCDPECNSQFSLAPHS